jgi:Mg/Co/Ni transporter MgtE
MLGNMPAEQLLTVLRAMPPKQATKVLLAMTSDRADALLARLDSATATALLRAADSPRRVWLLHSLTTPCAAAVIAAMPAPEAAQLLSSLPLNRMKTVLDDVPPECAAAILDALPPTARARAVEVMDPVRVPAVRRISYSNHAIHELYRTAAKITRLDDDRAGANLLAHVLNRTFGIAVRYVEGKWLTSHDAVSAELAVRGYDIDATLVISNGTPDQDFVDYQRDNARRGHLVQAVTWREERGGGALGRALVSMA